MKKINILQFFLHLHPSNCVSVLTFKKNVTSKKKKKKKKLCQLLPLCGRFYMLGGMFCIDAGDLTWRESVRNSV